MVETSKILVVAVAATSALIVFTAERQPVSPDSLSDTPWNGSARVRWRREGAVFELWLNEVTSQARVYKQTLDQFFRRDCRDWRPAWGDFAVEIRVELNPAFPKIDLDNIAKAVLDGVKGALFFDDSQVARLLVERQQAETEGLFIRVFPMKDAEDEPSGATFSGTRPG